MDGLDEAGRAVKEDKAADDAEDIVRSRSQDPLLTVDFAFDDNAGTVATDCDEEIDVLLVEGAYWDNTGERMLVGLRRDVGEGGDLPDLICDGDADI